MLASEGPIGSHSTGLFWQNVTYAAGASALAALAWPIAGAACCGAAAVQVGVVELVSVCELVVSSQGASATAAKVVRAAAVRTPRGGRTGGGLLSVCDGSGPAVVVTVWVSTSSMDERASVSGTV